jgi:AcrR family transcriptional regulator
LTNEQRSFILHRKLNAMGIEDRKQREREQMRRLILDAAKDIFLEKGYNQTSIRNIADKIEYSPGTIYLYFKEKDEIFYALHNEAFAKLFERFAPLALVEEPFERLKAMGRLYMDFAFNNKDLYDLMFIMNAPMNMLHDACDWQMGHRVFDTLVDTLQQCQAKGRFAGKDLQPLSFMIWSGLHGMCALYCRDRMGVMHDINEKQMMHNSYTYYEAMLETL